ncbi:TIGR02444 family protein [Pseudoalteromonas byunsanensis]|uniref:TIGR02444 family protein n=1 Tax=Pseudoalteromonas byunsanensis TaxID=327939 RepID=A0A1S1N5I3_9GAMM|nr:TIGR02444 family protein [Pseudoalteromonas byunsanensis]OHU94693.1 TIGR02444 family protein [Pseudoalteromonas byunsanensis]
MNKLSEQAFWNFSCQLYRQGGAQNTLLMLQNERQKNINLCLLLLYLEKLQLQIREVDVTRLIQLCLQLDAQLLAPHRAIRSELKQRYVRHPHYQKLREQLLQSELQLERFQQTELLTLTQQLVLQPLSPSHNLSLYLNEHDLSLLQQSLADEK